MFQSAVALIPLKCRIPNNPFWDITIRSFHNSNHTTY